MGIHSAAARPMLGRTKDKQVVEDRQAAWTGAIVSSRAVAIADPAEQVVRNLA